jgi:hypothetical protein
VLHFHTQARLNGYKGSRDAPVGWAGLRPWAIVMFNS